MARSSILLIEDEPAIRFGIRKFLATKGFDVLEADTVAAGLESFRGSRPDAAVVDYLLPDGNALDLLPRIREIDAETPVVLLTGHGSIDLAVRAIKIGAEHFLTKPVELETLYVVLQRVIESHRSRQQQQIQDSRRVRERLDPFVGESPAVRRLRQSATRVAAAESPVLLLGETGSGKGVLAAWFHENSQRAAEPFVDLNCAGLSPDFLETELFGHEKGAFTGAGARKLGLLEVAHRGTVFLDEIGDVHLQVQPKLLKVLEEKRFRRLGAVYDRAVDIRLIAATHHDLTGMVRERRFREDLFFRISTIPLQVPPLRERVDDIPLLAAQLLRKLCAASGRREPSLSARALQALQAYRWPGNIRELRNVLERAVLLGGGEVLDVPDLCFDLSLDGGARSPTGPEKPLDRRDDDAGGETLGTLGTLEEVERRHILHVFELHRRRVALAAEALGIPKSSLYQKLKKLGVDLSRD